MEKIMASMRLVTGFCLAAMTLTGCDVASEADVASSSEALTTGGLEYVNESQFISKFGTTYTSCPAGKVMVGYYKGRLGGIFSGPELQWIKCKSAPVTGNVFLDLGTQRTIWQVLPATGHTPMHACPNDSTGPSVMVGVEQGAGTSFLCQHVSTPGGHPGEGLDLGSQDTENPQGVPRMHVCLGTSAMSGLHVSKNQLGCFTDFFPDFTR